MVELGDFFIDVKSLPQDGFGLIQLCFLAFVYGYMLMYGSNMISDGSELLLLVPAWAGLVGSVVLPVLGAVPDGCMVLFSGLGPNAQGKRLLLAQSLKLRLTRNIFRAIERWCWRFGWIYHYGSDHSLVFECCWWTCQH